MLIASIYIIVGVVVVLLLILAIVYNGLVSLRNKVEEAFATMDVYLSKRFDLIPGLVASVKGYAAHEAETLTHITAMRTSASDRHEVLNTETGIGKAVQQALLVAEAYPDLKASQNFLDLQQKLVALEDDIACSRRYYNGAVREYNNRCQMFPFNLVANAFGFKKMPMFEAKAEEREVAKVTL